MGRPKKIRPIGRPTEYRAEYCDDIVKFFDRPRFIKKTIRKWIDGEEHICEEEVANETPFLIHWTEKIGVSHDAAEDWAKKHPEFGVAYNKAKRLQEAFLAELGIKGEHNGFMTFQALKNIAGWRDKQEIDQKVEGTQVVVLKYAKD